jgi:peptidyl-prolyl cis-trans isomerase D
VAVISMMRDYARSLKVVLLIVVVVFILTSGVLFYWGSDPSGGVPGNTVAVVNGEEIPFERFRRAQANTIAAYERMARQRLTPELAERLGLSQQVVNELVTEAVVIQGAAKEGVLVSDDELRATIQQIREFHEGGQFSREEYLKVLKQLRLEPGEFESEVRRHLVRRKMETLIKQGVKVSDEEIRQAYRERHERVRAAWAYADVKPIMATLQVADEDLEPYVKAHQAQFSQPERRKLQYVMVNPRKLAVTVSDAEAEAYYNEHAAEFDEPKRLRVAHVLVRVPPVGGSDAENAAKAKVEDIVKRARSGEDFAKLARELSEDKASAVQGGDLGFVGPGELVAPFEQAAFALKKGETSAPVRTPFGYHAIRVMDVKEGGRSPLKEVAPRIKETLGAQKSEQAAQARADEVRATLLSAKEFPAEAKRLGLEAQEATFGRGDALGEAGRDPQLDETLFGLAVGGVSTPIKTVGGFAVVKVVQHVPAGVPPVAEIRERVVEAIKRERAERQVTDRAKALVAALGKGGDFVTAAKGDGFSTGTIPMFSRSEPPKERGSLPGGVLMAALQTPAGQVAEPVRADGGVYVVKTLERAAAAADGLEKERPDLEKQVLEQKRALTWDNWMRGRLADSKVQIGGQPAATAR